jgi:hypothetical protein
VRAAAPAPPPLLRVLVHTAHSPPQRVLRCAGSGGGGGGGGGGVGAARSDHLGGVRRQQRRALLVSLERWQCLRRRARRQPVGVRYPAQGKHAILGDVMHQRPLAHRARESLAPSPERHMPPALAMCAVTRPRRRKTGITPQPASARTSTPQRGPRTRTTTAWTTTTTPSPPSPRTPSRTEIGVADLLLDARAHAQDTHAHARSAYIRLRQQHKHMV